MGGFGGFGLSGVGAGGEGGAEGEGGEEGGPMGLLNTAIPGVLLFLGIMLIGAGLFMFSMVKVWSPRIWLPMAFGTGIGAGGQVFKFRSRKIVMSFGAAQVCEICGVELALRQCFSCGRWFGPNCQGRYYDAKGNLVADDTRCIDCTTCAICGQPTKGYQCLKCGRRVCEDCLDETKRYCIECAGQLKIARKELPEEEIAAEASDAKVVSLSSPFGLPRPLARKITERVKSDLVGKELLLGHEYPSLGTTFRVVGASPSERVIMREDTRVKVES